MESSVVARSRPAPPGRRRPAANNSNLNNNDISNPSSRTSSPATKHSSLHPETEAASAATSTSSNLTTTPTTNQPSALSESQRSNLSDGSQILTTDLDARERLKNALRDCDKEELVKALTDAKDQIDQLDSSLENTTLSLEESQQLNQNLSTKLTELENHSLLLQHSLNEREERITQASTETNSLEQELFYFTSQNESLRNQLKEAESQKALAEKQYQEGNVSAEKEREYYEGLEEMMEKLKQSHNASVEKLRKEKADTEREMMKLRDRLDESTTTTSSGLDQDGSKNSASSNGIPPSTSSNTTSPEFLTLQSELAHLHKSHSTLSSTLHQLQSELKEVKSNRDELRDENETYRDILQEKTFSGALLAESAVLSGWKGVGGREGVVKGVFGNEDEESEDEEEDQDAAVVKNQDDVDDVPDTPRAMDSEKEKSKRNSRKKSNRSSQHLLDVPTDLASELEENDEDKDALEKRKEEERKRLERKRERNGEVSSDVSVLQKEVFELRDANKALTLYISKIIDRIVAKEGYESVLAADDDRSGKKAAGVGSMRRKAQATRPSVLPTSPTQPTPIAEDQSRSSAALKAARRQSGSILSLVGRATGVSDSTTTTTSPPQSNSQGQSQKRRTASIDWRSLIPGSSSSTNSSDANLNPNLRPFSLQATVPSGSGNRASMSAVASPSSAARRLAPTEEIEDATDKAERERIRAELEEQGITPPENQLRPNIITRPAHVSTPSSSALGAFFQRVVSGSTSSSNETTQPNSNENSNTNLSTGSSMIRTPSFDGPKLTTFQDPSPSRPQSESPIQISDKDQLRSKALDVGNDSLTEYSRPVRSTRNPDRSVSNRSSISRSSSVGGDESYGLPN